MDRKSANDTKNDIAHTNHSGVQHALRNAQVGELRLLERDGRDQRCANGHEHGSRGICKNRMRKGTISNSEGSRKRTYVLVHNYFVGGNVPVLGLIVRVCGLKAV